MRTATLLTLSFTLLLADAIAQETPPATDPLQDARQRLAAVGCKVPDSVALADRTPKEVLADLDAQQDLLFPSSAFPVQHGLFAALGIRTGKDAAALRRQAVAGAARGLAAYYDPTHKQFVLLDTASRDTAEAMAGSLLPLVTHELVHAEQDARVGGITGFFDPQHSSLDACQARRCVLEGEAEVIAVLAQAGEAAVAPMAQNELANSLDKLFAGEITGLLYANGRRLVGQRFLADGIDGVRQLWREPPSSTEQVMHPAKLGKDLPQAIVVPAIPGCDIEHRTTFGELMTYHLLRQAGSSTLDAGLAAMGWDGDEVAVGKHAASGAPVLVWRSVWDREVDAREFAAQFADRKNLLATTTGNVVDLVGTKEATVREAIAAACAATPWQTAVGADDAASTATEEGALRKLDAGNAVADGRWELRDVRLSIPAPEGWELREVAGTKMLIDSSTAASGFAVNVNVQRMARGTFTDLAALLAGTRQQLDQLPKVTVHSLESGKIGEVEVVRAEWEGQIGSMAPLHCLQIAYLWGDQQVWVTATTARRTWQRHAEALQQLMAGIRIDKP